MSSLYVIVHVSLISYKPFQASFSISSQQLSGRVVSSLNVKRRHPRKDLIKENVYNNELRQE
jgi:hypothetical protein